MVFLASLSIDSIHTEKIIVTNTWSECVAYCEGLSSQISSIQTMPDSTLILNHPESENCYFVTSISKTSGIWYNYLVWETDFDTLYTWIQSQPSLSIQSISERNIAYVVL
jgi:hypothetical protein